MYARQCKKKLWEFLSDQALVKVIPTIIKIENYPRDLILRIFHQWALKIKQRSVKVNLKPK